MRPGFRTPHRERGFAMIAIISLIALMSTYLIAYALSRTGAELSHEREQRSMNALRQAKAALIAYAASEQWQLYKCSSPPCRFQPGALPCPDRNNDGNPDHDGSSQGICSNALMRIGRLPWKTLGVDDLRDASGERLWYALSSNFRKLAGTTVINSDTQGLLTVTGTAPANNVVAIVFAPGAAIQSQIRPFDSSNPAHNNPASYLEGFTAGVNNYTFTTNAMPSDTFNDRLLVITQADLMSAVEPVVAARIQRDIKPYLDTYRSTWGRYPFAAPFSNPGTSDYKGTASPLPGMLPLTAASGFVTWANPLSTTISDTPPGSISSYSCAASTATLIDCNVTYSGTPTLRFSLSALNAGMAFVRSHVIADLTVTDTASSLPLTPTLSSINNSPPVDSAGKGTVLLSLGMPTKPAPVRIQIPPPPMQPPPPVTSSSWDNTMMTLATPYSAAGAGWFISNQWYKHVYYAVSPALVPGGGGNCVSTPPCLTVTNLPTPNNNMQAVLILAGRSLNGTARPSSIVSDYLEGANRTGSGTYTYEHRSGVPTSINDRVVVISP